jgi:hypothetical protein
MKNCWNLKLSNLISFIVLLLPLALSAQFNEPRIKLTPGAKEEKYLYPVYPGKPGSLAGTMGELRSTHFHSGIDIRTNNMIGLPVLASKSGYVSRATMTTSGYGNVLYITHPDGNTTLYAHLDQFKGEVAKQILQERYNKKTSEIDLYFQKDQFKVNQGDTVALSGNTGGSSGPHLHFDIRDSSNLAMDPLKFGFNEIVDTYAPAAEKIALQTLDINSRINDRFGRFEFYVQRVGKNYILSQPIMATGLIGVEILAKDKLAPKSAFFGGVNFIDMKVDSQLVFSQAIEKVNIAETRDIYTLMDFKAMRTNGSRFYKLFIDDGNRLNFYKKSPTNGKIKVRAKEDSFVEIDLKDSYGNMSTVSFTLRPMPPAKEVKTLEPMKPQIFYDITDNILMVVAKPCRDSVNKATVYIKGKSSQCEPNYYNVYRSVYLFDLRKEIPDSVVVCDNKVEPKISNLIPSGTAYKFYNDRMDITFPQDALYDTLYLNTDYSSSPTGIEVFTLGERVYPLNKSITVSLKPTKEYPKDKRFDVYRMSGKNFTFLGGEWVNGQLTFSTRELGDFTILSDTIPPTIRPLAVNGQVARFKIRDDLAGIFSFEASINGNWLLMNYDSKSNSLWSERLDKKIPLKGDFQLTVTDNAGNKKTFTQKIL